MLWPPRILADYPCPILEGNLPLTSGIRLACASQPTHEDVALIAETDKDIPETFNRALAGSFKEGTLRCLVDLTGTFLDRPARMPQIARGQCRSLSEEPNRLSRSDLPRAVSAPRSYGPGFGFKEEEESDIEREAVPITHALFIQDTQDLPSAPFPRLEKVDPEDEGSIYSKIGSTALKRKTKSLKANWRRRRSVSRVVFGRKMTRVIRLSDPLVGFGRRKSPAPGSAQKLLVNRKKETPVTLIPTPIGTASSANETVSKVERSRAMRQKLREMVEFALKTETPLKQEPPSAKTAPRSRSPVKFKPAPPEASAARRSSSVKAASVAAVVGFASEAERFERSVGGAEDKSFDEIFDWKRNSSGVPYWQRGPATFQ